ncbi:MAG TPA: bifunctional phosphoribosylaminoimidazolecarboxamide formyltransferase/IMP cyclohydrolase, partial [Candidatus Saccharimonadales bacterium]|nr:bifunctional phosphoribosylaminoimidazolecarboxamide formyltransferase/IMP cyclohydrolase [Candidatus Saccharimonadales bacterium]
TDPADYQGVVDELQVTGSLSAETRLRLACKAFQHTAAYDAAVATWFSEQTEEEFPDTLNLSFEKSSLAMRYGENPHQRAALYVDPTRKGSLARAIQHSGKDMSRNNYVDIDAAWRAVHDFANPCVAIIKHTNPCGIAIGADVADAERKAHDCDPVSAFGGVIAANRPVSVAMAQQVVAEGRFTEVIAAAAYEDGALEVLATKKSLRVLEVKGVPGDYLELRQFDGGLLVQTTDYVDQEGDDPSNWTLVAGKPADATTLADLAFAWRACRSVKSNAILLARDGASVGVGMGQVNRVDSCRLAVERASDPRRSVAASDAFFPFDDGPRVLIESGVKAIVEPGGSIRDQDTIALCEQSGITLYFTGVRHFAH